MWVSVGGQEYRDGEIGMAQVLELLGEGLSTSGPAPGELAQAATEADGGDGVVILTVSRGMSAVYDAARVAASSLGGTDVAVVDTGVAAGAQGHGRPLTERSISRLGVSGRLAWCSRLSSSASGMR